MMDTDMANLATFIADELRKMMIPEIHQLYQSGKMRSSVYVVAVEDDFIDIVIATDYASFTDTRGRHAGWVERTIDRCCRCYSENNDVSNESLEGTITYE